METTPEQIPKQEIHDENMRIVRSWGTVELKDKQGEVLPISEFKKLMPIIMDRGGVITDMHSNRVVGKILNYEFKPNEKFKNAEGLLLTYKIFDHYDLDDQVWSEIKEGKRKGLSFGGQAKSSMKDISWKDGVKADVLRGLSGFEFSTVYEPANQGALNEQVNYLAKSEVKSNNAVKKRLPPFLNDKVLEWWHAGRSIREIADTLGLEEDDTQGAINDEQEDIELSSEKSKSQGETSMEPESKDEFEIKGATTFTGRCPVCREQFTGTSMVESRNAIAQHIKEKHPDYKSPGSEEKACKPEEEKKAETKKVNSIVRKVQDLAQEWNSASPQDRVDALLEIGADQKEAENYKDERWDNLPAGLRLLFDSYFDKACEKTKMLKSENVSDTPMDANKASEDAARSFFRNANLHVVEALLENLGYSMSDAEQEFDSLPDDERKDIAEHLPSKGEWNSKKTKMLKSENVSDTPMDANKADEILTALKGISEKLDKLLAPAASVKEEPKKPEEEQSEPKPPEVPAPSEEVEKPKAPTVPETPEEEKKTEKTLPVNKTVAPRPSAVSSETSKLDPLKIAKGEQKFNMREFSAQMQEAHDLRIEKILSANKR